MPYSNQKKGILLAFTAVIFITPDSLFIRLADIESWNLIFYRGFIPFLVVFVGLLIVYKSKLIRELINNYKTNKNNKKGDKTSIKNQIPRC